MKDGRGLHMKKIGDKMNKRIKDYMALNPEALRIDVCRALSITPPTLRKHIKRIQEDAR